MCLVDKDQGCQRIHFTMASFEDRSKIGPSWSDPAWTRAFGEMRGWMSIVNHVWSGDERNQFRSNSPGFPETDPQGGTRNSLRFSTPHFILGSFAYAEWRSIPPIIPPNRAFKSGHLSTTQKPQYRQSVVGDLPFTSTDRDSFIQSGLLLKAFIKEYPTNDPRNRLFGHWKRKGTLETVVDIGLLHLFRENGFDLFHWIPTRHGILRRECFSMWGSKVVSCR